MKICTKLYLYLLLGLFVTSAVAHADDGQSSGQASGHSSGYSSGQDDIVKRLLAKVEGQTLPSISVDIPEVSLNRSIPDPAAETEMAYILQKLGFRLIDVEATNELADIEVSGEAFSEFGLRKGNLVSTKARVEIKALSRDSGVVLVDRETAVAVDLSPEIAGKIALAKASANLTERLVTAVLALN
ncbi:MAG: hypothetical protein O7H39_02530 [Gammaproteobacteria bacterium]|nr:hypothetical protein [Gammaproteobacteria bacterium]